MTAQTSRERQEALRARRAMLGMTEVRGVYLYPNDHAAVKRYAKRLRDRQLRKLAQPLPPSGWLPSCTPRAAPRAAHSMPGSQSQSGAVQSGCVAAGPPAAGAGFALASAIATCAAVREL